MSSATLDYRHSECHTVRVHGVLGGTRDPSLTLVVWLLLYHWISCIFDVDYGLLRTSPGSRRPRFSGSWEGHPYRQFPKESVVSRPEGRESLCRKENWVWGRRTFIVPSRPGKTPGSGWGWGWGIREWLSVVSSRSGASFVDTRAVRAGWVGGHSRIQLSVSFSLSGRTLSLSFFFLFRLSETD